MCELTHGMAGERHAMCDSALSISRMHSYIAAVYTVVSEGYMYIPSNYEYIKISNIIQTFISNI